MSISNSEFIHPADHVRAFEAEVFDRMGAKLTDIGPSRLVRFDDPEKPRGNKSCWAVLHLDGCPAGAFGNWRTGESHTWRADRKPQTREERERNRVLIEADRRKREQQRENALRAAADTARSVWQTSKPATTEHPYIAAKRASALGIRALDASLVVPLRNVDDELTSLQYIRPDGCKRFITGGRIKGCFCLLAPELPRTGELYICEGWATAATINAVTRLPVAAAMNAGNLKPVAEAIRAARPSLALVIAADNDHRTEGNPGLRHAKEAARAGDGGMTWPRVCLQPDCTCTDFNDVQHCGRAPA